MAIYVVVEVENVLLTKPVTKVRVVVEEGDPAPHNIGHLREILETAIKNLPKALAHVPVATVPETDKRGNDRSRKKQ